jgi:hypothetical protein
MRRLRCLIGCEMSGVVRDAFAARGWEAVSADLLASETNATTYFSNGDIGRSGALGYHYQGDVRDLFAITHPLNARRGYEILHRHMGTAPGGPLPLWDLAILHPPCDHLAYAGARWFKLKDATRGGDGRMQQGAAFFMEMVNAPSPLVAVENPHCIMQKPVTDGYAGPPTQIVQPWMFGDAYVKGIHLWLKGLPPLTADHTMGDYPELFRVATGGGSWRTDTAAARKNMSAYEDGEGRVNRAKVRSRTMPGLARSMAEQWGSFAEGYYLENRSPSSMAG